jgi:hypothetical protein
MSKVLKLAYLLIIVFNLANLSQVRCQINTSENFVPETSGNDKSIMKIVSSFENKLENHQFTKSDELVLAYLMKLIMLKSNELKQENDHDHDEMEYEPRERENARPNYWQMRQGR